MIIHNPGVKGHLTVSILPGPDEGIHLVPIFTDRVKAEFTDRPGQAEPAIMANFPYAGGLETGFYQQRLAGRVEQPIYLRQRTKLALTQHILALLLDALQYLEGGPMEIKIINVFGANSGLAVHFWHFDLTWPVPAGVLVWFCF